MAIIKEDLLARAKEISQAGVDYTPRYGAICPWCGTKKLPVARTMPWDGSTRVRYHKCPGKSCIISKLGIGIKSIEEDYYASDNSQS